MRLLLFRHAKSSWDHPGLSDHDRPLSPRGIRAASAMRQVLEEDDLIPDRVLVSSAKRTQQTADLLLSELAVDRVDVEDLYLASPREMLRVIGEEGGTAASLMVIGHNPGTQDLAERLSVNASSPEADRLASKFPTAALAVFRIPGEDWTRLHPDHAHLLRFIRPKDLPDAESRGL